MNRNKVELRPKRRETTIGKHLPFTKWNLPAVCDIFDNTGSTAQNLVLRLARHQTFLVGTTRYRRFKLQQLLNTVTMSDPVLGAVRLSLCVAFLRSSVLPSCSFFLFCARSAFLCVAEMQSTCWLCIALGEKDK